MCLCVVCVVTEILYLFLALSAPPLVLFPIHFLHSDIDLALQQRSDSLQHIPVDLLWSVGGHDVDNLALLLVLINHRHAGLHKGPESFGDRLQVIIGTARGLSALHQALKHHVFWSVEKQNERSRHDRLLELHRLIHLSWEPINQEPALPTIPCDNLLHRILQKLDCDFHRHNLAVLNTILDELSELRTGALLFGAEQVAGGEVSEGEVAHEVGALGALSGSWAAEDEYDCNVLLVKDWDVLLRALKLFDCFWCFYGWRHVCGGIGISAWKLRSVIWQYMYIRTCEAIDSCRS